MRRDQTTWDVTELSGGQGLNRALMDASPTIVALVTFMIHVASGNELCADQDAIFITRLNCTRHATDSTARTVPGMPLT
eukprot:1225709-Rhodomonas_salina.2